MKTSSSFNSKSRILCYSLLLFLLSLPFIITDLYFGFQQSQLCLWQPITNTKISFVMATWLKVNGFVCCILSITLVTLSLILYFLPKSTLFFGFLMTLVFDSCFRVTWGIVGGVMYFGFLLPRSDCTEGVEGYLLVTVLGEFGLVVGHCLATRVRGEGEVMVEEEEGDGERQ